MAKAKPVPGLDERSPILANTARIIDTRLGEMLDYERHLSAPDQSYQLHQMRIAAKRLRYTMEIFEPIYAQYTPNGPQFSAAIAEVKSLQEYLGALHDADVLVPRLIAHLARLLKKGFGEDEHGEPVTGVHHVDFEACQGLLTLCQEMRARRDKQYQKLILDWQRLRDERFFDHLREMLQSPSSPAAAPGPCAGSLPKDESLG